VKQDSIVDGSVIAHYRILSRIGSGGMGEVYLARDTKLERSVALKVLPGEFLLDKERVARFIQEAKTASALNHPNIITIHEIGQEGKLMYIATEFIEGETLRLHMNQSSLSVPEALEIAIQVASALAAAHAAGVVHRDIKPENLMIRRDGILKVLDFGVAKLSDTAAVVDREAQTINLVETAPGTLLGTAAYMSPEQARGRDIDGRTDVWSLGVVVYEMITGQMPFEHETPSDVIAAILKTEPPPLSSFTPDVPLELERITAKALEKNQDERYQGIKDMAVDLRRLRKQLDIESELESLSSGRISGIKHPSGTFVPRAGSISQRTTVSQPKHSTSSAEYLVSNIKKHKLSVLSVLGVIVLALAAGGYGLYRVISRAAKPSGLHVMEVTRFTSTGKAVHAAISPDGNYVAHVAEDGGQQSVWIGQVAAAGQVQIIGPSSARYGGLTFSNDGNFLFFVQADKDNPRGALFQIPALGGTSRKVLNEIQSPIGISPDGKRFAFVRYASPKENSLIVTNSDGSNEQKIATRRSPDFISTVTPSWSPDGSVISYVYQNTSGGYYENVFAVRVADGVEAPITNQRWWNVGQTDWLSDGSGLIASATEDAGSMAQLWYIPYKSGDAKRITSDLNGYADVTLTRDSKTLASVRSDRLVNLWSISDADLSKARQVTSGFERDDGMRGLAWTPDGKIVYRSVAGGEPNVWMMKADGSEQKQLTVNSTQNFDPAVSPDGRSIVWAARRTANTNLWRMDIDGGAMKQITTGVGEYMPSFTPDGKWVLYTAYDPVSGFWSIWKVPAEGGSPARLTEKESAFSAVSPDGQTFACNYEDQPGEAYKIAIIPIGGGQPAKVLNIPGSFGRSLQWSSDGKSLTYVDTQAGVSNLWSQSLSGGAPKQLTDFKEQRIYGFAWSPDGKQLAISRGVVNNDVVLIKDFRP
jgi:eukaryotic-like serine/threonine-protein kinase